MPTNVLKMRKYLKALESTYKKFMSEKMYGKYLKWTPAPKFSAPTGPVIQKFDDLLKKAYAKYRAVKMVKSLNKEQQEEMRQKVNALDIFAGKKPWE
jgi:hypothetical protein